MTHVISSKSEKPLDFSSSSVFNRIFSKGLTPLIRGRKETGDAPSQYACTHFYPSEKATTHSLGGECNTIATREVKSDLRGNTSSRINQEHTKCFLKETSRTQLLNADSHPMPMRGGGAGKPPIPGKKCFHTFLPLHRNEPTVLWKYIWHKDFAHFKFLLPFRSN